MRNFGLFALLLAASYLLVDGASAQTTNRAPAVQTPAAQVPTPQASAAAPAGKAAKPAASTSVTDLASRPDAARYYWHNGDWWYFTAQNNWLRWNGTAWVQHHSLNESGALSQGASSQGNVVQPQAQAPTGNEYAPSYDRPYNGYRFQINRRRAGL